MDFFSLLLSGRVDLLQPDFLEIATRPDPTRRQPDPTAISSSNAMHKQQVTRHNSQGLLPVSGSDIEYTPAACAKAKGLRSAV